MALPAVTVVGHLTADPELRTTASGVPVATFSVAANQRSLDRNTNEWKDTATCFVRAVAWRQLAENIGQSLTKGMEVIVVGNLKQRDYETREGEKRTAFELDASAVGPSLSRLRARCERTGGGGGGAPDVPFPNEPPF